jgi:hypothetical protein
VCECKNIKKKKIKNQKYIEKTKQKIKKQKEKETKKFFYCVSVCEYKRKLY